MFCITKTFSGTTWGYGVGIPKGSERMGYQGGGEYCDGLFLSLSSKMSLLELFGYSGPKTI